MKRRVAVIIGPINGESPKWKWVISNYWTRKVATTRLNILRYNESNSGVVQNEAPGAESTEILALEDEANRKKAESQLPAHVHRVHLSAAVGARSRRLPPPQLRLLLLATQTTHPPRSILPYLSIDLSVFELAGACVRVVYICKKHGGAFIFYLTHGCFSLSNKQSRQQLAAIRLSFSFGKIRRMISCFSSTRAANVRVALMGHLESLSRGRNRRIACDDVLTCTTMMCFYFLFLFFL